MTEQPRASSLNARKDEMSQFRRIKTLVRASFRRRPAERAEPGARVTPVTLGSTSAVPQSGLTKFDAGGYEIAVANVGGTFYALSDICTHRGCSLSEGELAGTTLECICHGSRFDVSTGDVLRGPAQQSVQVYAVRVQGDALVVDVPSAS
jgi:3-phenylpropionate/trans-cinnamate dioxygenase ferredoxin component